MGAVEPSDVPVAVSVSPPLPLIRNSFLISGLTCFCLLLLKEKNNLSRRCNHWTYAQVIPLQPSFCNSSAETVYKEEGVEWSG